MIIENDTTDGDPTQHMRKPSNNNNCIQTHGNSWLLCPVSYGQLLLLLLLRIIRYLLIRCIFLS